MTAAGLAALAALHAHLLPGGRVLQLRIHIERCGGDNRGDELLLRLLLHIAGRPLGDFNALPAALAVAQDVDLAAVVRLEGLRRAVQGHLHGLPQQVHALDVAGAVGGLDEGLHLGHPLGGVLIGVLLVLQAAHQTAASAGNLGGIQAQVLGLGHLDGDGHEPIQKLGAAEGPAADAQAADHLSLVPDADLPQFDPGPEHRCQVPYQLPEVHTTVGGEVKDDLVAVKAGGNVHQLHLQTVVRDLLLADVKGLVLPFLVVFHGAAVILRGRPQHGAQGLDDGLVIHLVVALRAGGEFRALGSLHDYLVPHLHLDPFGVKIIILASAPKADADHFRQRIPSNSAARAPNTWPGPTL